MEFIYFVLQLRFPASAVGLAFSFNEDRYVYKYTKKFLF